MALGLGKAIRNAIDSIAGKKHKEPEEPLEPKDEPSKEPASDAQFAPMTDASTFCVGRTYVPSLSFNRIWRFNRPFLKEEDQKIYDAMSVAIKQCLPSIKFDCGRAAKDAHYLINVLAALMEDDPSLFYIDSEISVNNYGTSAQVIFKYNRFKDDREKYYEQMKSVARQIYNARVRYCHTVYEAELAIHDYFTRNTTYDSSDFASAHSPVGPLLTNRGVCEGISEAYCFVACACGVKTAMASGILNKDRHRWNIVEIEGQPYHLDVTSDLNGMHAYFNCSDDRIRRTHTLNRRYGCVSMVHNYYVMNGASFGSLKEAGTYIRLKSGIVPGSFEFAIDEETDSQSIMAAVQDGITRSATITVSSNNGCFKVTLKDMSRWPEPRNGLTERSPDEAPVHCIGSAPCDRIHKTIAKPATSEWMHHNYHYSLHKLMLSRLT